MRFDLVRLFVYAALLIFLSGNSVYAGQEVAATSASVTEIKLSFKLDPRLTKGMYMGDRWVSPPTYTRTGKGKKVTVEARAQGFDARGKSVKANLAWVPADPDMVTVTQSQGNEVKITVKRDGQSKVTVTSQEISKELIIKATHKDDTVTVEILQ